MVYLMADNHHVSEDLTDLFNGIPPCRMFKQWNEDVLKPISVKSFFLKVDSENGQNTRILELSESSFHQFKEFLSHFKAEDFISSLVVSEEQKLKIAGI